MSLFYVDEEKCLQDGRCVDECPRFLVEIAGPGAYPTPIAGAAELCTNCGHCVAVCPTGALTHRAMRPGQCEPTRGLALPSAAEVEHFLSTRRSIRAFEERAVPRATLEKLLDVARYAPTASNRQPVEWLVIHDSQEVRRLARLAEEWLRAPSASAADLRMLDLAAERGLDRVCRGAPHVIVAHTPSGQQTDGVIALTHLELAAYSLGLGACWGGSFTGAANNSPAMKQALGLPEGRVCAGAMLVGYPKYEYARIPVRKTPPAVWR